MLLLHPSSLIPHPFRLMLYPHLLSQALESKREEFLRFDRVWREDMGDYSRRLRALGGLSAQDVAATLSGVKEPGAIPSGELDDKTSIVLPFGRSWRTHEEARRWAIADEEQG